MFSIDEKDLLLLALLDERNKLKDALDTTGNIALLEDCERLLERIRHNGWMRCSESKPEDTSDVLIIDDGETAVGYYLKFAKEWYRCGHYDSEDIKVEPTYWMPIPTKPKKRNSKCEEVERCQKCQSICKAISKACHLLGKSCKKKDTTD